ncbi:putative lipoprotein [Pectobacterium atrosepticum SCRI1043]|uniref:Lipoprotein n=1 Tax=Pectobacterium atrosepticum (strain SCRI 1043 / ATCC BAA-672) TaxID=218491 RepID=Q6D2G3_PECAS|nr:hypothetical protein [Pectobacterium atrosepticum]GKV84472.1 hypothetical protein PEC301296_07840 [Pectobacterium carotovorum subsp. carotovorum]AIA71954.1 hypothetical protein EV46_15505 [Pectobacterium atrosepticum]AIK14920.1 putative lipoprotein [Pectobacterium atrosepticum]ATY91658.1 hypothetical protein CVS35_15470 [Pectobacterium atrosepticum]KFX15032.1 lipoprotein [Pectobacterium atrosepticum]
MKYRQATIHRLLIALITLFVTACSSNAKKSPTDETPECMKYRLMMTAPLPPAEMMKLKNQCEQSRH